VTHISVRVIGDEPILEVDMDLTK